MEMRVPVLSPMERKYSRLAVICLRCSAVIAWWTQQRHSGFCAVAFSMVSVYLIRVELCIVSTKISASEGATEGVVDAGFAGCVPDGSLEEDGRVVVDTTAATLGCEVVEDVTEGCYDRVHGLSISFRR